RQHEKISEESNTYIKRRRKKMDYIGNWRFRRKITYTLRGDAKETSDAGNG
ncbi:6560_t:CDS:1, partial [Acaulospora morrowiae]